MKNEGLKKKIYNIIFEAETPAGRLFDLSLLVMILLSILVVMLETVSQIKLNYGNELVILEWIFLTVFLIEYLLRIYCLPKPMNYILSTYGIIDFIALIPAILLLVLGGSNSLLILRALRLLRIFRIFKLSKYLRQGELIMNALKASREKIFVFVIFVLILVSIFGSLIYVVEGDVNEAFDSIPRSIYWAIVTLTTVGYGDISPITPLGQVLASVIMISGYAILAVPTGIVTGEIISASSQKKSTTHNTNRCPSCLLEGHEEDAIHCRRCGEKL